MASPRYTLTEQLHFLADTPDKPNTVVTVQRWDKPAGNPAAVYVVCFNGTQHDRRVCTDKKSLAYLTERMAKYRAEHAADLLSEEAADAQVRRRGGPALTWCHRTKSCGAPVPYAAAVCADGHPTESVGRIAFASVTKLTMTGGGQTRG